MKTRIISVNAGGLYLGGSNPVRVQSMCNTNIMDTNNTLRQGIQLAEAGCEMIRAACPGVREAEHLKVFMREFRAAGFKQPIIADIHFNPKAAETAALYADKIRINPGNYSERKYDPSNASYDSARDSSMEIARKKLKSLVSICKDNGTVVRVGVNQGSLSPRILYKYGDTAEGMSVSALEYIDLFESLGFTELVLSLKSSSIANNIKANRLFVSNMSSRGRIYPLHLGVTEAGGGIDGILKSVAGIGTLLAQDIGDTIRVSLTGDPVREISVARKLVDFYNYARKEKLPDQFIPHLSSSSYFSDYNSPALPFVISSLPLDEKKSYQVRERADIELPGPDLEVVDTEDVVNRETLYPLIHLDQTDKYNSDYEGYIFIKANSEQSLTGIITAFNSTGKLPVIILDEPKTIKDAMQIRNLAETLFNKHCKSPLVVKMGGVRNNNDKINHALLLSPLLVDDIIHGVWVEEVQSKIKETIGFSFMLLQACGKRLTSVEYVACPTCGRSTFDVEKVLEKVKEGTIGLKPIKIAVMGCIVNGPGEMRDADYGYVGAGKGLVTIYRKQEVFKRNIPESGAVEELLKIIDSDKRKKYIS